MKGLVAALGMLITVVAVIVLAIVELLIKLAPLLVAAAVVWLVVKALRAAQSRHAGRDRLWGPPDVGPVQFAALPPAPWPGDIPAHSPATQAAQAALPPVIGHRERMYVVRGEDTGLLADREDG
ncbi:MAG: hypothetical protein ACRDTV_24930, partial [Mycobacterium sp.]